MQARLFSQTGETRGSELALGAETIIGRDRQGELVIDQPLMSSRHARIFYDEDTQRFILEDLGSLNGTELDGDQVTGPERLGHLHVITFAGTYDFFFQDQERCCQRHPDLPTDAVVTDSASDDEPQAANEIEIPAAVRKTETTSIDREPIALPGFLARRADEARQEPKGEEQATGQRPFEITKVEQEPAFLPAALAKLVEQAKPPEGDSPEGQRGDEGTVFEKLPVALPGNLALRADHVASIRDEGSATDVHRLETVDLNDIEELIAADPGPEPEATADGDPAKTPTDVQLIVTEPDGRVRHFPLILGENLIGRGTRVQVSMIYRDLSRRHAVLSVAEDKITIRDLRSRNRTYLGDVKLEAEVEVAIEVGARLRFGSVEARLASTSLSQQDRGESS